MEYYVTENGLKYRTLNSLDELAEIAELDMYDRTVAESHLYNYGVIFIGEFDDVLDNQYELEEIFEHYQSFNS